MYLTDNLFLICLVMNFLSHYYFERYATQPERVLGSLLPDLLKNVDKSYVFHPEKFEDRLLSRPISLEISEGWYRHVEVDKIFHSSSFFLDHCHALRPKLQPVLENTPIRGTFMAHIAIELLLDHLLIKHELVQVGRLYDHLESINKSILVTYLKTIGLEDIDGFMEFYGRFLEWKYIYEYKSIGGIAKPLFSISRRIWNFQTSTDQETALTEILKEYTETHLTNFRDVYSYIQDKMTFLP